MSVGVVADLVVMRDRRWAGSRRYKQEPPEIFFPAASAKNSLRKAKFLVERRTTYNSLHWPWSPALSRTRHPTCPRIFFAACC